MMQKAQSKLEQLLHAQQHMDRRREIQHSSEKLYSPINIFSTPKDKSYRLEIILMKPMRQATVLCDQRQLNVGYLRSAGGGPWHNRYDLL